MRFRVFTTICFLYIIPNCYGQFEGVVSYKISYKSLSEDLPSELLSEQLGDEKLFYISEGNYKVLLNGELKVSEIFLIDSGRIFYENPSSDTVFWVNQSESFIDVINYEINASKTVVLGKYCDELIFQTTLGETRYYYNKQFSLDSDIFSNHKYNNWDLYSNLSNAVPLKIITKFPQFIMTVEAIDINSKNLVPAVFQLPVRAVYLKKKFN